MNKIVGYVKTVTGEVIPAVCTSPVTYNGPIEVYAYDADSNTVITLGTTELPLGLDDICDDVECVLSTLKELSIMDRDLQMVFCINHEDVTYVLGYGSPNGEPKCWSLDKCICTPKMKPRKVPLGLVRVIKQSEVAADDWNKYVQRYTYTTEM